VELRHVHRNMLTTLERLKAATSPPKVVDIMASALKCCGAEFFCFNFLPVCGQKFEDVWLAHNVPAGWFDFFLRENFCAVDPSLRHCKHTVHPFEYLDAPYDRASEPQAAEVIDRARDFRVEKGLLVPIAGPAGCEGDVWIGGYDLNIAPPNRPLVHLLALYAFETIRVFSGRAMRTPSITPREREVLTWVAAGKSAWEIGEILHISKRTVDEHCSNAALKLNAKTRTQAVAYAMKYRLIEP
jgi:LuxR family transcriptional regulator, quorum-sensing system regulator BjaR1